MVENMFWTFLKSKGNVSSEMIVTSNELTL